MKFTIGDRVILKQTGEEGTITDVVNKEMWEVEVNGTRFPVYTEDIDHPYLKWFTEKNNQKKAPLVPEQLPIEKVSARPQRLAKGIYLSFMPVFRSEESEDIVDVLKVYLLNETAVSIRFSYDVKMLNKSDFRHEGTLHPFGHLYLHSVEYGSMNDQPRFHWRLADASNTEHKHEEGVLRIKPGKLFEHINHVLLSNEPTFSYLLVDDFVVTEKSQDKDKVMPVVISRVSKPEKLTALADLPRYELDLHIEQLVESYRGLTNSDIMDIQLKTLERYLSLAIIHRLEKMIIIHGVGTGILKDAVHRILKEIPEVKKYSNQWLGNYGFGATEVFFQY
jgi:hypothetical protein